jgi:hypothetical protein
MILFMGYGVLLATLLGLAAARVESAQRSRGWVTRWTWLTALGSSVGVAAWALLRPAPAGVADAAMDSWARIPVTVLTDLGGAVVPSASLLARADSVVAGMWLAASAALGLALVGGLWRLSRRARGWAPAQVGGGLVLLSEDFGPAVLGLRTPRVVLPRWALALEPERLRLVVLHEEEHRRAGDVALLMAGSLAVVLAPWNPALWWQLHRLRAAVEMDCDARVLKQGAPASLYGRLLLEMGTREAGFPLPVAALSRPKSLLERRLTMIVRGGNRGSVRGAVGGLAAAALMLIVACETPMPTAVRPAEDTTAKDGSGDVAAGVITAREQKLHLMMEDLQEEGISPLYVVDGRVVPDISGIQPDHIVRVEVVKGGAAEVAFGPEGQNGVVHIFTKDAPEALLHEVKEGGNIRFGPEARPGVEAKPGVAGGPQATMKGVTRLRASGAQDVTVYVDGDLFEGALEMISPDSIERIEVVKGKDPTQPSAIYITLKKKGAGRR